MTHLMRSFNIIPGDFVKAGEASIQVQGILKAIGFDTDLIRRISICAYEAEMNVVMHGGDGTLFLLVDPDIISLEVKDNGPGIEDIELAFQEGYSTAHSEHRELGFGAGMGLPNIKRNADHCELYSKKGEGSSLKMRFKA